MRGQTHVLVGVLVLALLGTGPVGAVEAGGGFTDVGTTDIEMQATCDYQSLYDETIESVVTVQVLNRSGQGLGSGFVYDDDGRIVTNQHVVANASTVEVQFSGEEWRTAEVIGTDVYSDLAVLKAEDVPDYVRPLEIKTQQPEPGQPVAAFGSPLGLAGTITSGIVSGANRSLPAGSPQGPQFAIPNTIQTTAAINPGNSGGPLVNCQGEVVGVNTATVVGSENTGFAIPASRVQRIVPALVENGSFAHSFLGITSFDVSPVIAEANDLDVSQGVLITSVIPESPADDVLRGSDEAERVQGIEVPVGGDVIVGIEGRDVESGEDLSSYLAETRPGETVTLTILRDGQRTQVEVTLGERPPPGEEL